MPSSINALSLRKSLGLDKWAVPTPFGPDGWLVRAKDRSGAIIISVAPDDNGVEWIHASISRVGSMPTYDDLKTLHVAAFGNGWAYQVFAPAEDHINIHEHCLHLFGRLDGKPQLPDFTNVTGTI